MRLNRNEIKALLLITSSESVLRPLDINAHLGLRRGSVSRIITNLRNKGLVDRENSEIVLAKASPADSFKRLYYAHRPLPSCFISQTDGLRPSPGWTRARRARKRFMKRPAFLSRPYTTICTTWPAWAWLLRPGRENTRYTLSTMSTGALLRTLSLPCRITTSLALFPETPCSLRSTKTAFSSRACECRMPPPHLSVPI